MRVVRRTDVDYIDVVPANEVFPVRGVLLPAKEVLSCLYLLLIAAADYLEYWLDIHIEKPPDLTVSIAMSLSHKLITYQSDV
jgi:hypothetical protein